MWCNILNLDKIKSLTCCCSKMYEEKYFRLLNRTAGFRTIPFIITFHICNAGKHLAEKECKLDNEHLSITKLLNVTVNLESQRMLFVIYTVHFQENRFSSHTMLCFNVYHNIRQVSCTNVIEHRSPSTGIAGISTDTGRQKSCESIETTSIHQKSIHYRGKCRSTSIGTVGLLALSKQA